MLKVSILNIRAIFFFAIVFFISESYAKEDNCLSNKHIKKDNIKNIEIKINNERNYLIKISRKLIEYEKGIHKKKKRKKYKAIIIFNLKDGESCWLEAKVRPHGDAADHVELIDGKPISSLRVSLKNGNIDGITKFILLRPKSRFSDNEVFVSSFFSQLGYLSPRTFYINVNIHELYDPIKFLFQENIKKELLEYNDKVEGPIIESNEDFSRYSILQLGRVSNKEWIKNDIEKLKITLESIKRYNQLLINSYNSRKTIFFDDMLRFNKNFFSSEEFLKISSFDAFMFAIGAGHGLSFDDRRFYYDPIYRIFEPIYYDGNSNILSFVKYNLNKEKYTPKISKHFLIPDLFTNDKENSQRDVRDRYRNPVITNSAFNGADHAKKQLLNIDKNEFLNLLLSNGLSNFNMNKLDILLNEIIRRLETIKNSKTTEIINYHENIYEVFYEDMNLFSNVKLIFLNSLPEKFSEINNNFQIEICSYNFMQCEFQNININKLITLIEQRDQNKNSYGIFFSFDKKKYLSKEFEFKRQLFNNFSFQVLDDNIQLAHTKDIEILQDTKKIDIYLKNKNSRVVIFKSNLRDYEINVRSNSPHFSKNANGLTGCLTILDSILDNISLDLKNLNCEDSVNFIRSSGTVKKIKIENSKSDGVDADFSKLDFKEVNIKNSSNDCVDFSYGNYLIEKGQFNKCGDKGISVGENSNFNGIKIDIKSTKIGVASKDSSFVRINNLNIETSENCLAAYKKKQEFGPAFIKVNKFQCENYYKKINTDTYSKIILN